MLVWACPFPDLRCPLPAPWPASLLRTGSLCHKLLPMRWGAWGPLRPTAVVTDFSPWPGPVLTVALGEGWRLCSLAALPLRDRVGSGCPGHDGVETWATGKFPCSSAHHGAGASPVAQSCKSWHGTLHLSPPENISVSAACSGASPKHGELPPCVSSPLGSFLFLKVLCSEGHWAGMGGGWGVERIGFKWPCWEGSCRRGTLKT